MSVENYSKQKAGGYFDRLTLQKRELMYQVFARTFPPESIDSVLDVGITANRSALSSNYFERLFPDKNKIIALSNQAGDFLEAIYPGLTFKQGDAKDLPFPDLSVDVVFSSAVIEHLGCEQSQKKMIAECYRVAKKGVFITTPNRWHPVDAHTMLPLIHWLPKAWHRYVLKKLNLSFYAQEANLNLQDGAFFKKICQVLGIKNYSIQTLRTFGFVSNLLLIIRK